MNNQKETISLTMAAKMLGMRPMALKAAIKHGLPIGFIMGAGTQYERTIIPKKRFDAYMDGRLTEGPTSYAVK